MKWNNDDSCVRDHADGFRVATHVEHERFLHEINDTAVEYPHDALLHELFEAQAELHPDAVALVSLDRQLTYAQLNSRANQIAHALRESGVRAESRVGLYAERSIEALIGVLGILKAGGAYVPVDPNYPRERVAFMIADSTPVVILTCSELAGRLAEFGVPTILLDADLPHATDNPAVGGLTSRSLAYVIYTSGSTGLPKGVMIEHRSVVRLVIGGSYAPIGNKDCVAHCSSPSFDAATWEIWAALLNGARLVVVPHATLLNPREFNALLVKHGVTSLFLTVGLFNEYFDALEEAFGGTACLITGGDILNPRSAARILAKATPPGRLLNAYGPTETTTYATTFQITDIEEDASSQPIGRPIANTSVYILTESRTLAISGATGEICIGGPGVARGYLNRPELTAERFIPDPFSRLSDGRLYRSGDLGRWLPDGNIEYAGRNDTQIKIRGFRVELSELEIALQSFPGVRQAVATARTEDNGQKRLVAYVVPTVPVDGQHQFVQAMRKDLEKRLPSFMLPGAIVLLPTLPLNSNGKVDRRALPEPSADAFASDYVAPNGDIEEAVAQMWQELLRLQRVGRHDNLIELGGDSIIAMKLVVKLTEKFSIQLDVQDVIRHSSLSQLAETVERMSSETREASTSTDLEFEESSF